MSERRSTHPSAATLADDSRRPLAFIDALVGDLQPVRPAASWPRTTLAWFGLATLWVVTTLLLLGPVRPGLLADLLTPRLLAEGFFAVTTLVALAAAGLEWAVPGAPTRPRLLAPALLFGLGWAAVVASGDALVGPDVSMEGKRLHCFLESLFVGAGPAFAGLLAARQRSIRPGPIVGALVGMAAGALPAFGMQLVCMADPQHALEFHYPAILVLGMGAAALAGVLALRD